MKRYTRNTIAASTCAAIAAVSLVATAAGSISTAAASVPTVNISVASLIPGSTAAATAAFNAQVKQSNT